MFFFDVTNKINFKIKQFNAYKSIYFYTIDEAKYLIQFILIVLVEIKIGHSIMNIYRSSHLFLFALITLNFIHCDEHDHIVRIFFLFFLIDLIVY